MSGEIQANQAIPPPPAFCNGFLYTVQPGDTLFFIGQRFGVSVNAMIAANPQIPDPNLIFPGQVVCVPTAPAPPPPPPFCSGFLYTVQPGDTLFFIAQRFGVSLQALIAANPQITNPSLIFPGQVICIPGVPPVPGEIECCMTLFRTTIVPVTSGGVARVRQFRADGGNILIGTIFLPDPATLGTGLTTYVAWVRGPSGVLRKVPLTLCLPNEGVWVGVLQDPVSPVAPFNDIIVTAETSSTVTVPGPTVVLQGFFSNCR